MILLKLSITLWIIAGCIRWMYPPQSQPSAFLQWLVVTMTAVALFLGLIFIWIAL